MKKTTLIIISLVWVSALIILIISLTNLYPNTIFSKHRLIIGITFITITRFLKPIYNSILNKRNNLESN